MPNAIDQVLIGAMLVEVCVALLAAVIGGMHTVEDKVRSVTRGLVMPTRTCEYVEFFVGEGDARLQNRRMLAVGVAGGTGETCIYQGKDLDTFNQMPEASQVPEALHYSSHEAYANGAYNVFLRNSNGHTVGFLRIRPN